MSSRAPAIIQRLPLLLAVLLVASVCLTALVGITVIATGETTDALERLILQTVTVMILSAVWLAQAWTIRCGKLFALMTLGMSVAAGAASIWTYLLWMDSRRWGSNTDLRCWFGIVLSTIAIGIAYTGIMMLLRTKSAWLHWLRLTLIGAAWLVGIGFMFISNFALLHSRFPDRWFFTVVFIWQFVGLGVLVGTMVVPLAFRGHAKRLARPRESVTARAAVTLDCPQCRTEQKLTNGPARCRECGFTMLIEIEEPRCTCGYLLYQLKGEQCPECGRAIPVSDRWAETSAAT